MMKIDETAVACCGGKIGSIVKIKSPSTELKRCIGHEAVYFGGRLSDQGGMTFSKTDRLQRGGFENRSDS
jgi:hypothetical protein